MKILNAIKTIITVLFLIFTLWVAASWVDIIVDNSAPNPHHSPYNAFVLLVENF